MVVPPSFAALPVSIAVSGFDGFDGEEQSRQPKRCWDKDSTKTSCNCANDRGCRRLDIVLSQFGAADPKRHPELGGHVSAMETRGYMRSAEFNPAPAQGYHWGHNAETYYLLGKAMASGMLVAMGEKELPGFPVGQSQPGSGLLLSPTAAATSVAAATPMAGPLAGNITCAHVPIPSMTEVLSYYRAARICWPEPAAVAAAGLPKPSLHLFAHADFGGGPMTMAYDALQSQIASYNFVVAEYLSCAVDQECSWAHNGMASFVEVLKLTTYLEDNAKDWSDRLDLSKNYSVSGHSTGARVVLMLAALKDTPAYMSNIPAISGLITPAMRASVAKIGSVVSDHPDMMYLPKYNGDIAHYNITKTPTLILTGSKDTSIEAPGSAWRDFKLIQGHTKAFFDLKGADHSEPVEGHRGGPFIAKWSQLFALGDESAATVFYSNGTDSISSILPASGAGDANTGDQKVGYVACREDEAGSIVSEPSEFRNYC